MAFSQRVYINEILEKTKKKLKFDNEEKLQSQLNTSEYINLVNLQQYFNTFINLSSENRTVEINKIPLTNDNNLKPNEQFKAKLELLEKTYIQFLKDFPKFEHKDDIEQNFVDNWGFYQAFFLILELQQNSEWKDIFEQFNQVQNLIYVAVLNNSPQKKLTIKTISNINSAIKFLNSLKFQELEEKIGDIQDTIDGGKIDSLTEFFIGLQNKI